MVSQKSEIEYLQKKLQAANEKLSGERPAYKGFSENNILSSAQGGHKVEAFCNFVNL